MFSGVHQPVASHILLHEVASSGVFPDPALFIYSVLGVLALASVFVAYLVFGTSVHREESCKSVDASIISAPPPRDRRLQNEPA